MAGVIKESSLTIDNEEATNAAVTARVQAEAAATASVTAQGKSEAASTAAVTAQGRAEAAARGRLRKRKIKHAKCALRRERSLQRLC